MPKSEKRPSVIKRENAIRKELGVAPALAGAAVYEGLPRITRQLLSDLPSGLTDLLASGKSIKADGETPLARIAEFTRAEVKAIKRFAEKSGVVEPIKSSVVPGQSYFYDKELPTNRLKTFYQRVLKRDVPDLPSHIGLTRSSVPHAFHEIGHAAPIRGSVRARRLVQDIGMGLGQRGRAGALARYAALGNVLLPPDEDASRARRFAYDHAPEFVGATMLPELAEEGRASLRAVRGAKLHNIGTLRAIKELAPAFGTYIASAAAPIIATVVARNLVKALHRRREEGSKTAAQIGAEIKAPGVLRNSAAAAWRIGGATPPKPKDIKPNSRLNATARGRTQAKPPSNLAYYKDLLESLYNPQRWFRIAKAG
ncbi:MAG: hypothetical protein JRE57_00265 [Deltaproteobacteria bacterium]|nr:hypothetical protein [Deltaproteobacteria bacterium]